MPQKLKRPCNKPGCPELTNNGYCDEHKKQKQQQQDERRGTAHERGYTYRWAQYSTLYRKKHPLCVMCEREGKIVGSQHVDHIIAVRGAKDPMFWKEENHQALCQSCHSRKTIAEDGGFVGKWKSVIPTPKGST